MAGSTINVLLTSFPGLGLPSTLCLPLPSDSSIADFTTLLSQRIPPRLHESRLILTTNSNREVQPLSLEPLSSLSARHALRHGDANIFTLRLSHALCGGKGGFGSQLRAAGGRMSSRKKRNQGDSNGSSRNLDGRRLRTVTEAKALAEYLAVKPEMDKQEKEERRKRWEQVVETSERREEEIRSGAKAKVDGKWVEAKEEAENKTREAVVAAMKRGWANVRKEQGEQLPSPESAPSSASDDEEAAGPSSKDTTPPSAGSEVLAAESRKIFGWDEDDEDLSDSEDEDPQIQLPTPGKAVAVS